MKKRTLLSLLCAVGFMMLLPLSAQAVWDGPTPTIPPSVDSSYYSVTTAAHLAWIAQEENSGGLDRDVWLGADIDLGGYEWDPIGKGQDSFDFNFHGNGHTIRGLRLTEHVSGTGLFGTIGEGGFVDNLYIEGEMHGVATGGLIANVNRGTIDNVHCTVTIGTDLVSEDTIGGAVATNAETATLYRVTVGGDISTKAAQTGGVVAVNNGNIVSCGYTGGTLSADYAAGGLAIGGIAGQNSGSIALSYSLGTVTSAQAGAIGGIVGDNLSGGTVTSVYTAGTLNGPAAATIGAIAGTNAATVQDAHWLDTMADRGVGSGADPSTSFSESMVLSSGKTLLTHLNEALFAWNQDPNNLYAKESLFVAGEPYPVLYVAPTTTWFFATEGAPPTKIGDVYQIGTPEELAWFLFSDSNALPADSMHAVLTANIDLSAHLWQSAEMHRDFSGTFDGRGFSIRGLHATRGFFYNTTAESVIKNFNLSGYVFSDGNVGAVVFTSHGLVENVSFDGIISAASTTYDGGFFGGIANTNTATGIINNARFSGEMWGYATGGDFGGIAGGNKGLIINCATADAAIYVSDDASGTTVGGIVGDLLESGTVTNCYSTADITGVGTDPGGVVGRNYGTLRNVYSTGFLVAEDSPGGVLNFNASTGVTENAYWLAGRGATKGVDSVSGSATQPKNVVSFTDPSSIAANVGGSTQTTLLGALQQGRETHSGIAAMAWVTGANGYPVFAFVVGDLSGNGATGIEDLILIAASAYYNTAVQASDAHAFLDVNDDGNINFADLAMLRNSKIFGK